MTDDDTKLEDALKKCAQVHLPDDFADRLVVRIREGETGDEKKSSPKSVFSRLALIAASLTLLLGFVPGAFNSSSDNRRTVVVPCAEIRSVSHTLPQDSQLNALAFLGFCREVVRHRVRSLLVRCRKREEEE